MTREELLLALVRSHKKQCLVMKGANDHERGRRWSRRIGHKLTRGRKRDAAKRFSRITGKTWPATCEDNLE